MIIEDMILEEIRDIKNETVEQFNVIKDKLDVHDGRFDRVEATALEMKAVIEENRKDIKEVKKILSIKL
jgi:hypothetical protein